MYTILTFFLVSLWGKNKVLFIILKMHKVVLTVRSADKAWLGCDITQIEGNLIQYILFLRSNKAVLWEVQWPNG